MKISERCSCGATFEADDGAVETGGRYQVEREHPRTFDVEAQTRRWRSEHHHNAPRNEAQQAPAREDETK